MKKLVSFLLAVTLAVSLVACGGNTTSGQETDSQPAVSTAEPSSAPEETPDASQASASEEPSSTPEETAGEGGTLVAYFSWSGNTAQVAEIIARETGADLFEIATVTPYTEDYDTLLDLAQEEQGENARPQLDAQVENWDSYDTIFLGYPNWWSDAPMAVYTFLESYDFSGKTLIPFNTSASSGFGRSLSGIQESAAGATILEGLALTEGELSEAESRVTSWLEGLALEG